MAFCTECGFNIPDDSAFCPGCGKPSNNAGKESGTAQGDVWSAAPQQAASTERAGNDSSSNTFVPPSYERPYSNIQPPTNNSGSTGYGNYMSGQSMNPAPAVKKGNSKAAIIVGVLVLLLVAAGIVLVQQFIKDKNNSGSPAVGTPPVSSQTPSITQPGNYSNAVAGSGYVENDEYYISFIGAEEFTDIDNESAIRIYYEFTNYYGYPQAAWYFLDWTATQDGIELEHAYAWDDVEVYDYDTLNIRPDLTIQCCLQFKYNPSGGVVDLSMYGYNTGETGGVVTCTYVPGELPGAPAPYVFKTFADPTWTTEVDSAGYLDYDDYYVAVTDAELIEDNFGSPAIRIYYEFTNHSDEPASLYYTLNLYTYQDGVSLYPVYAEYETETDKNVDLEIGTGETITASCVFVLRNTTSSVEAEIEASLSYRTYGQTFKITD